MEQISHDDRLILQLIERLTRVKTKLDTMLVTLEKSNESFMDLIDHITQVESEASRPDEVVKGKDDDNDETGS